MQAGLVAGVTEAPEGAQFTRNVFSGKASAQVKGTTDKLGHHHYAQRHRNA